MCTPPENGRCYFLELPQETRNQVFKYTAGGCREENDGSENFSFQASRKFMAPVAQLNRETRIQALQVWLETHTIILRSGRAMFYFKDFMAKHNLLDHVRGLYFPSFHWFNPGHTFTGGRHGPPGIYGDTNGDVELMTMCPKLRKVRITLDVTTKYGTYEDSVRCHTVEQFKRRYPLQ